MNLLGASSLTKVDSTHRLPMTSALLGISKERLLGNIFISSAHFSSSSGTLPRPLERPAHSRPRRFGPYPSVSFSPKLPLWQPTIQDAHQGSGTSPRTRMPRKPVLTWGSSLPRPSPSPERPTAGGSNWPLLICSSQRSTSKSRSVLLQRRRLRRTSKTASRGFTTRKDS